ncbi:MAG: AAA family ATPase [Cyclonatronaceae bacterium]
MSVHPESIKTLGELKKSGWKPRTVKDEMRSNLMRMLRNGDPMFSGILGYEKTVIPQLQNAILARHDIILLGLRGQAKTRILRSLIQFLDEYIPVIEGSEISDDPFGPLSRFGKDTLTAKGDDTPLQWLHRSQRYAEKLATPDTTVADLIGDIDPIKAATRKMALSDEKVINYGVIPRTNRGIFAINELPDLQPRIQVSLLNIMQERDIQIRGFNVRIPLDIMMVFSANPEDYTNRGNIITPLKDRIDSQIITHYPKSIEVGIAITEQEAWTHRESDVEIGIPDFMKQIIQQISFEARESEYIDEKSGVSARLTITAMEQMVSAAERRAIMNGDKKTVVRISDLYHGVPALTGKMELVYEGEQEGAVNVAKHLIGKAISAIFRKHFPDPFLGDNRKNPVYSDILQWFARGYKVEISDALNDKAYATVLAAVEGLEKLAELHGKKAERVYRYAEMDFILEALHQKSMLGKEDVEDERSYSDMIGSMLGNLGSADAGGDDDDDGFDDGRSGSGRGRRRR